MISVALLGFGYWGEKVARNLQSHPQIQLSKIVDCNSKKQRLARHRYPKTAVDGDFEAAINDSKVEAIAIFTPIHTHFELAKRSLQSGKSILLAKPAVQSSKELSELLALGRKSDLTALVDQTFVYSPAVQALKDLIDQKLIGKPRAIKMERWNVGSNCIDSSIQWDLLCHDLSIYHYIFSDPITPLTLVDFSKNLAGHCDELKVRLKSSAEVEIDAHVTWKSDIKKRRWVIDGDLGSIAYDEDLAGKLQVELSDASKLTKLTDLSSSGEPLFNMVSDFCHSYIKKCSPVSSLAFSEKIISDIEKIEALIPLV